MMKHGMRYTKEYKAWAEAKQRCHNPKSSKYKHYGARGIFVCEEWLHDFVSFFNHIGRCPEGFQLDRIDNDKGYVPGNVRWVTKKDNINNRRTTVFVTYQGRRMLLKEYADIVGVGYGTAWDRAKNMPHLLSGESHRLRGTKNVSAKLNDETVLQIRNSTQSTKELREMFGVSRSLIQQIRKGIGWEHVSANQRVEARVL